MTPFAGLRALACPHTRTTDADDLGKAICCQCGIVVQAVVTRQWVEWAVARVRLD